MNEQVREQGSSDEASSASERLRAAVDAVVKSKSSKASVNTLNGLLRSTSLESADRGERAALLLKLLAEPSFKRATDDSGATGRATAVKALLDLGYPHALQVHPDDLAFLRDTQKKPFAFRKFVIASVAIGALLAPVGLTLQANAREQALEDARARCLSVSPEQALLPAKDWYESTKRVLGKADTDSRIDELAKGDGTSARVRDLCQSMIDPLH